ncbi:MAG: hypothetical protein ACRC1G_16905 [Bradyrhizobium sp.]
MIQHRFPPNEPMPLFLAGPAGKTEPSGLGKFFASKLLKKAALVLAAVAIVCGVVSVANAILSARVTASPAGPAEPLAAGAPSAPAIPSTASAGAATESQLGDELAAVIGSVRADRAEADRASAGQASAGQASAGQASADALLNQFQAWAAGEDAQALPVPPQPVPGAEAAQDAEAEIVPSPPLPRRRPVHVAHTARPPDPSPQNAPSLAQRFGFRN